MTLVLNGSDTSAGDDAGLGYTSAEGVIITGQGTTSDVTIKNDADATVLSIPTGTTNVDIVGVATATTFEPDGDTSSGDNAAIGYTSAEGLILTGQGSTSDVTFKNDADATVLSIPTGTTTLTAAGQVNVGAGLIAQTDSNIGAATANSGSGRYFDIYNTGADAATFAILRLITQQVGSSSTTSADFAKYKNGALVINNNDTHANVYTALGLGGSERMRISSAGNIAINTTNTGDNKLTVEGGVAATNGSSLALKSGGGANSRVADLAFYGTFVTPTSDTGQRRTADITSGFSTANWGNEYLAFGVGTGGANDSSAVTTERMRITGAGHLLVGTTNISLGIGNTNTGFQVENNGTFLASRADQIAGSLNRNNDGTILSLRRSGNEVGTIGVTSSATSYNTSSDYRLKENVSYTWDATSQLKQLKPAKFNFIADPDNTVDGFLAHEVSSIVPEAITGTKDAVADNGDPIYQCIDQSKLVPLLVKTIQELEARITTLEAG